MNHILLSFLFYNFILFIFYRHYRKGDYYINKSHLFFYTLLLIGFGTYGTGEGDYLHYKENISYLQSMLDVTVSNGMEIHYNYLAYILGGNYTLWRLVLFSVQFVGMSWLLYKSKLNTYPVLLSFVTICLLVYTYQRSYWGVIFYFLGLYLLFKKKNPLFLIVIALCYFAHTQNIALLALLPLGFINFKRWQLFLLVLLIGTMAALLKDYLTAFIKSGGIEDADYFNEKISRYGQGGTKYFGGSLGELLLFLLRYIPMTVIVLTMAKLIFISRAKYLSIDKSYRGVINVAIGLVIASLVVLAASSLGIGIFFYRLLSMVLFPVALLLPYMKDNKILKKKDVNNYILLYIVTTEFSYVKDFYYAYAHGIS